MKRFSRYGLPIPISKTLVLLIGGSLFLFILVMAARFHDLSESKLRPQMNSSSQKKTLRVLLGTNKKVPFDENNPTNALETFLAAVLGQLVYSTGAFEVEPGLIESWKYDIKTASYDLKLKDGIKFHNGRLATSSDLEFSLVRHLIGPYGSWFRAFFSNIDGIDEIPKDAKYRPGMVSGIQVINDRVLRIRLKRPNPSFLHSLARSYFSLVPIEAFSEDTLEWLDYPVGAGPYRVEKVDRENGNTLLSKIDPAANGPDFIEVFMEKPEGTEIDISLPGVTGSAQTLATLKLPLGITLFYFNYNHPLSKDPAFRASVRVALNSSATQYTSTQLKPTDQLLPRHFWGRLSDEDIKLVRESSLQKSQDKKLSNRREKIVVYDSGANTPDFFSFLEGIRSQLKSIGIEAEILKIDRKMQLENDSRDLAKISTLGADVMDPLILFGVFREGSPIGPYIPPFDERFERLFLRAAEATQREDREATIHELAAYFEQQNYVIPLFERYAIIAYNADTIESLGAQNGSLIFYLDRISLK